MRAAAFFDLDKTIIAKSSTLAFAGHLSKAGLLSKRSLLKAGIAQAYYQMFGADHDQLERIREEMTQLTKGWDREQISQIVAEDPQFSQLASLLRDGGRSGVAAGLRRSPGDHR